MSDAINTANTTNTTNINHTDLSWTSVWVWAVPVVSLLGFLSVSLTEQNQTLFFSINQWNHSPFMDYFWANITILGDTLVAIALLSLFARQRPEIIWALLIAAVFATLWVHGLKPFFENPRPGVVLSADVFHVIGISLRGNSFPSGHSTTAFTLAGVICLLRIHPLLSGIALLLATLSAISRIAVGAHWPLDIFAGAFGGWSAAIIGVMLFQRLTIYKQQRQQWINEVPGQRFINISLFIISLLLFFHDNGYPESQPFQFFVAFICATTIAVNIWFLFKTDKPTAK